VTGTTALEPDLERLMGSVIELLTDVTECHACFVYLREGSRLQLHAASEVYAHLKGEIELDLERSFAGWVARHRAPAFIRDNAVSDPRTQYVAEVDEDRFQSLLAAPISAGSGDVIGVVVLHTVAPREFDQRAIRFLAQAASLLAGAIENARLSEATHRREKTVRQISALSQDIAAAVESDDLYRVVTGGVRALVDCAVCRLYRVDPQTEGLELVAADPPGGRLIKRTPPVIMVPVAAGEEQMGMLAAAGLRCPDASAEELLRAFAHQVGLALKRLELTERLEKQGDTVDLFTALSVGNSRAAERLARAARVDLSAPYVVLHIEPTPDPGVDDAPADLATGVEQRLCTAWPAAHCQVCGTSLRAVLAPARPDGARALSELDRTLDQIGVSEQVVIGRSGVRRGASEGRRGLREAQDAVTVAAAVRADGGALAYDELGAYKYLVRIEPDDAPEDAQVIAVRRLVEYDDRRRTRLTETLERYLVAQRSLATAARALHIHRNTLRQRLGRIEKLTGLDLAAENSLALELAIKAVRLRAGARITKTGG
jgi:GAF domain-containing protein